MGFIYTIRGIISEKEVSFRGYPVQQMQFIETVVVSPDVKPTSSDSSAMKLLRITEIYNKFLQQLQAKGDAEGAFF